MISMSDKFFQLKLTYIYIGSLSGVGGFIFNTSYLK